MREEEVGGDVTEERGVKRIGEGIQGKREQ
jgi:hypothetical protein